MVRKGSSVMNTDKCLESCSFYFLAFSTATRARSNLERKSDTSSSPALIRTRSGSTLKDLAWALGVSLEPQGQRVIVYAIQKTYPVKLTVMS